MQNNSEIILSRERFFVPASLKTNKVFCGDEREPDTDDVYIHMFGGVLNPVKGLIVINEVINPASTDDSFENYVRKYMPLIKNTGGLAHPGVHSDVNAETEGASASEAGAKLDLNRAEGPIGCGYAQVSQAISQKIVEAGEDIIEQIAVQTPYLFRSSHGIKFAREVIEAHKRLSANSKLYTSGRKVVLAAVEQGADTMLVRGSHVADTGIINMDPSSTAKTGQAFKEGLPFYLQDSGSVHKVYRSLSGEFGYDMLLAEIAEQIDTRGTMLALGVTDIAVRGQSNIQNEAVSTATAINA